MTMLFMKVMPTPDPTITPNPSRVQQKCPVTVRAHMTRPTTWRRVEMTATPLWETTFSRGDPEKPAVFMKIVKMMTARQSWLGFSTIISPNTNLIR